MRCHWPAILLLLCDCSSGSPHNPAAICTTQPSESNELITVDTNPEKGASCTIKNGRGEWTVNATPGIIGVERSNTPLSITCVKDGYLEAKETQESISNNWSMADIVRRGFLSQAYDAENTSYSYPTSITLSMVKTTLDEK